MRNVMYRFYVDRGQCRVIYPDDVNIEYTPETGQKFFRERIGSKIVFVGTDYDYIMQQIEQDFGHKFEVLIRRSDDGGATWYDWHEGQFHATDCVINTNDKKITVQPATDDAYTEILAGLDKEYNLVEITQQVENVVLTKRPLLQVYVLGDSKVTCILSGMVWEQDATQEYEDERMVDHYNFNLDSIQRELNVTGSGLPAAVGLYYGTLAYSSSTEKFEGTLHPKESTGYYIYCAQDTVGPKPVAVGIGLVQIKRTSDDAVMYEYYYHYDRGDSENSDNIDFTFDAITGSGVMSGEMATYRLYTRIICDVTSYLGQPTKEIPADDIVPNNRNYRMCTMNAPMTPVPLSVNQTQWDGYYTPAGVWQADTNFSCRHYLVTAGKSYYFSGRHRDDSMVPFVLWFTANGDFISAERYGTNYVNEYYEQPITAPAGAAFCYLNVDNSFMSSHKVGYYTASSARIGYMSGNTSVNPTQWGRTPTGEYYAPPVVPGAKLNPVGRTLWRYTSMWVAFNTNVNEEPLQKQFTLRDAYSLTTTIQALLAQVAPSISFGNTAAFSQFLFGANPVVSGETIGTLYITQKTNLLNGEYSQPAMNAPITLGQVLNMLKNVYGCYWFIENNNLRIEHISFFENGGAYTGERQVGADLTQMVNPRSGKTWAFMTGEWQYSKAEMTERYEYQWMDESTEMFRGQPIEVVGTFIERGKIEDITISGFNADIDYILMNPSDVSEDGFAIMAAVSSGGQMVVPMVNMGTQQQPLIVQNGRMALTYVQPRYLIYNMPSWALKVNGGSMAAKSIQKGRTQTVKIPCGVNDLDLKKLVKTEVGVGAITKVTMPLLSRVAQVTIGLPTYELNQ